MFTVIVASSLLPWSSSVIMNVVYYDKNKYLENTVHTAIYHNQTIKGIGPNSLGTLWLCQKFRRYF